MIVDVINPKHCLRWFLLIWPVHTHWWHKSLPSVSHIQSKLAQWNCLMASFRKNSVIHPSMFIHKALLWLVLRPSLLFFFFLLHCSHTPSFLRTCQKTADSSYWWRHASTSSRQMRMSSHLPRVTSSVCLVRRKVAGGREHSMAGLGGFLATMSVKSKALVGVFTFMHYAV